MAGDPSPAAKEPKQPFFYSHVPKNVMLIALSLLCLPVTTALTVLSVLYTRINPQKSARPQRNDGPVKTILVTGVSMTKGLTIARLLSKHSNHRILGADIEPLAFTSPGRWSSSISRFYRLQKPDRGDAEPYIDSLLSVLRQEKVDLWISCSSVVAATEDGDVAALAKKQLGASFQAIQFSPEVVEQLHEKDRFIDYIQSLGLLVPASPRCTSSSQVLSILNENDSAGNPKQWIMKPIGVDDRARNLMMTLLPLSTPSATKAHIESLNISPENPFILQQYIAGPEYCTHALVVNGAVKAFTACPSLELLMHYTALDPSNPLFKQMLSFTERVAAAGGPSFTGHLSFDFLAAGLKDGKAHGLGEEDVVLYPIECNPRAHTAVVLFMDTPEMADVYLDVFAAETGKQQGVRRKKREGYVVPRKPTKEYYWFPHDLVSLAIVPLLNWVFGAAAWDEILGGLVEFRNHVLYWRDGTFVSWDPVPFLVLYHVYWPVVFWRCLVEGRRWSRINVSTTKVFDC